jgi:ActR/RegA family two-component response regulator
MDVASSEPRWLRIDAYCFRAHRSSSVVMEDAIVSGKRTVLVVDGDPAFGKSLEQDFKLRDFEIEVVGTAEEAIVRVSAARPDLVVLDLYLAEAGALKLLRP